MLAPACPHAAVPRRPQHQANAAGARKAPTSGGSTATWRTSSRMLAAPVLERMLPIWLRMNNTGISRFDFLDHESTMIFHNHVGHLPAHLIT